jgi:hypothetical protein
MLNIGNCFGVFFDENGRLVLGRDGTILSKRFWLHNKSSLGEIALSVSFFDEDDWPLEGLACSVGLAGNATTFSMFISATTSP